MVDIAVVNSFILFQLYRKEHGHIEELQIPKGYSAAHYREELARELGDLPEYGVPPVHRPPKKELADFETAHIPKVSDAKRNKESTQNSNILQCSTMSGFFTYFKQQKLL